MQGSSEVLRSEQRNINSVPAAKIMDIELVHVQGHAYDASPYFAVASRVYIVEGMWDDDFDSPPPPPPSPPVYMSRLKFICSQACAIVVAMGVCGGVAILMLTYGKST